MKTKPLGNALTRKLLALSSHQPESWQVTGREARPGLHGLIRYPAMMVPSMQGDILDVVLDEAAGSCAVLDPFVGSGTTMIEALRRGVDFTGIDINPLAVLVCEAKVALNAGHSLDRDIVKLHHAISQDSSGSIDVSFSGLDKWFSTDAAQVLSRIRRGIMSINDVKSRKIFWVAFADTIRVCSNSRTSTYKLHIRPVGEEVPAAKIVPTFMASLKSAVVSARECREASALRRRSKVKLQCADVRRCKLGRSRTRHDVLITSPPYGDNQTTIPYGQYSYLAMNWIAQDDISGSAETLLPRNTHYLDSLSLGGSIPKALNSDEILRISPSFSSFMRSARSQNKEKEVRKVLAFMQDYYDAMKGLRPISSGGAHWILTTGNRRAAGILVPFDDINEDIVNYLGGKVLASIRRSLPGRRMPSRNSQGEMITAETTMIAEFR